MNLAKLKLVLNTLLDANLKPQIEENNGDYTVSVTIPNGVSPIQVRNVETTHSVNASVKYVIFS